MHEWLWIIAQNKSNIVSDQRFSLLWLLSLSSFINNHNSILFEIMGFKSGFSNSLFFLVFLTFVLCNHAHLESENIHSDTTYMDIVDLEKFKYDLFLPKQNNDSRFDLLTPSNQKCLHALSEIAMGLRRKEKWAIKSNQVFLSPFKFEYYSIWLQF